MIREIIRPKSRSYTIDIPKEYLNRDIEILIFPLTPEKSLSNQRNDIIKKTSGILADKKINPVDWQKKIRTEWENRA